MFALTLTSQEALNLRLPTAGDSLMYVWVLPIASEPPQGEIGVAITDASGEAVDLSEQSAQAAIERIQPGESPDLDIALSQETAQLSIALAASQKPSFYNLKLTLPKPIAGAILLVSEPQSALTLSTWAAPLSRRPNEPASVYAELKNSDSPIENATVTAYLTAPNESIEGGEVVTLLDDGKAPDLAKGDCVYSARLPELPPTAGPWIVRFEARGPNDSVARTSSAGFVTDAAAASLSDARAVLTSDSLNVSVTTNPKNGTYRLDLIVADARWRTSLAWAEQTVVLLEGSRTPPLTIAIPRNLIEGAAADLLVDIRLLSYDPPGIAGHTIIPVTQVHGQ